MSTPSLTMSPVDILKYQNELVRTGNYFPIGRMQKIAIAPAAGWKPRPEDPVMRLWGRMIELRDSFLPIAHSPDRSMILITATQLDKQGRVALPDLPDPEWTPPPPTREEIEGVKKINPETGMEYTEFPKRYPKRYTPRLVKQSLFDRAEGYLTGTNFLVFSPVVNITFQPESDGRLLGDTWLIAAKFNGADNTHPTLLVDRATGETHFFGGVYQIMGPRQG